MRTTLIPRVTSVADRRGPGGVVHATMADDRLVDTRRPDGWTLMELSRDGADIP